MDYVQTQLLILLHHARERNSRAFATSVRKAALPAARLPTPKHAREPPDSALFYVPACTQQQQEVAR